jgi:LysR family transcriptional activator of nhaA
MSVERLNFHHLRYFWAVAHEGNLTRTAKQLRVAQSALSAQIRELEADLGVSLFARKGRSLVLTEHGRIALTFADTVFGAGADLLTTLTSGRDATERVRIGAVSTLSRNFQNSFVQPLLGEPSVTIQMRSGRQADLLEQLADHELDVVLSNRAGPLEDPWRTSRLAQQAVSVIGQARETPFRYPDDLDDAWMILPTADSDVRPAFEALCTTLDISVYLRAEIDDMATLRLVARSTGALALTPSVVVRDELLRGELHEHCVVPGLFETFYSITVARAFPHPLLDPLLRRDASAYLAVP